MFEFDCIRCKNWQMWLSFFSLVLARTRFGKKHFRLLWFQDSICPISFSLAENLMQLRLRFLEHIYFPPLSIFSFPRNTFLEHISGSYIRNRFLEHFYLLPLFIFSFCQKGFHCSNLVQESWTINWVDGMNVLQLVTLLSVCGYL